MIVTDYSPYPHYNPLNNYSRNRTMRDIMSDFIIALDRLIRTLLLIDTPDNAWEIITAGPRVGHTSSVFSKIPP